MALVQLVAPQIEPLTTAEAKAHLRVTESGEDSYIESLIKAARRHVEGIQRRALIRQTWALYLDAFPTNFTKPILVPNAPLIEVNSITYIDGNGTDATWDPDDYQVDAVSQPGRILPAYESFWPTTRRVMNAVTIEFVAGYGDEAEDVPEDTREYLRLLVGAMYENRESEVTGAVVSQLKFAEHLLMADRLFSFQ